MELGLATFADLAAGLTPEQRMKDLIEEATLADELGLDVFAIGEHHREDFLISSPAIPRAGTLGLPLTLAIIGGQPERFAKLYREALEHAGHDPAIGLQMMNRIGRERGWPLPVDGSTKRAALAARRGRPRRRPAVDGALRNPSGASGAPGGLPP